jgi:hypothetical protein
MRTGEGGSEATPGAMDAVVREVAKVLWWEAEAARVLEGICGSKGFLAGSLRTAGFGRCEQQLRL